MNRIVLLLGNGSGKKVRKISLPPPPPSSLMLSLVGVHLVGCLDVGLDRSWRFILLLLLLLLHAGCWALPGRDAGLRSFQSLPMVDRSQQGTCVLHTVRLLQL